MKRSRLCACAGSRSPRRRRGAALDLDAERANFACSVSSGCGKTTTLRVIAGFERPHAGSIEIGGGRVYDAAAGGRWVLLKAAGRHGLSSGDYALPHLSVARNVAFGLPRNVANREGRVAAALTTVGLAGLGERTPTSSQEGSNNGWRWRAPWRRSRR